jgi:hypothetical protein
MFPSPGIKGADLKVGRGTLVEERLDAYEPVRDRRASIEGDERSISPYPDDQNHLDTKNKKMKTGERGISMNQSGGLKVATIVVMAMLGFSTLAVGMQLSSGGTAAVTHSQTDAKSDNQGKNQTDSACDALTKGIADTSVRNLATMTDVSVQRLCPATAN